MIKVVFALGAENGGALSNLRELYNQAKEDRNDLWYFVVSVAQLQSEENIKVLNYPTVKKSWFHRLWFDVFIYKKIVQKYKPDEIHNQQTYFRQKGGNARYFFYETNALFFTEVRIKPTDSFSLWLRKVLLYPFEKYSIKHSDVVIVESDWLRKTILLKLGVPDNKIMVKHHNVVLPAVFSAVNTEGSITVFFYPASAFFYKNHVVIIEALKLLPKRGCKVVFTLTGTENKLIRKLKTEARKFDLPILWNGNMSKTEMVEMYNSSILLFPSFLESAGLPLYEARLLNRPIICADFEYSKYAMSGYNNVVFFSYNNSQQLAELMKQHMGVHNA